MSGRKLSNYPTGPDWPTWDRDDHNDEVRIDWEDSRSVYLCREDLVRMIAVIDGDGGDGGPGE